MDIVQNTLNHEYLRQHLLAVNAQMLAEVVRAASASEDMLFLDQCKTAERRGELAERGLCSTDFCEHDPLMDALLQVSKSPEKRCRS